MKFRPAFHLLLAANRGRKDVLNGLLGHRAEPICSLLGQDVPQVIRSDFAALLLSTARSPLPPGLFGGGLRGHEL